MSTSSRSMPSGDRCDHKNCAAKKVCSWAWTCAHRYCPALGKDKRRPIRAAVLAVPLLLGGCGVLPTALSAAGGAMTILKDGLDIDVAWHQLTPGKTPVAAALPGRLVAPAAPPTTHTIAIPEDVTAYPGGAFVPLTMAPVWSPGDPVPRR